MKTHTPRRATLALALAAAACAASAAPTNNPLWLRDAAISPSGKEIAFCYKGDIWIVDAAGGEARRFTATDSQLEESPVWSPDGKRIAYATDRFGGLDVMIADADGGGAPLRLTDHSARETPMAFSADGTEVIFGASIQDPAASRLYPTGRLKEVYAVKADGSAAPRQLHAFNAESLSPAGNDGSFVFHDQRGYENEWRKHHTSSATRDVWRYDASTGRATNLTAHAGEDRNPVVSADGATLYFLSERDGGSMNVWAMPIDGSGAPTALTRFATHPVRFLSIAPATGTLAFTYDGELYTLAPGATEPAKVEVTLRDADDPRDQRKRFTNDFDEMWPSPDGKLLAWTHRGDVFVGSAAHETSRQITFTPAREYNLSWGADGKTLYYTSERNGRREIYAATLPVASDPDFARATRIEEKPVLGDAAAGGVAPDRERPMVSPDGKKLLFVEDRSKIMVMDLDTRRVTQLTDGSNYPQRDGGFALAWNPDSRWVAAEVITRRHDPYTDVAIIDTDSGEMVNITDSGYFDSHPVWAYDGQALLFLSERHGMRNHASWGSLQDVMVTFLTQEALDNFLLSDEDLELRRLADDAGKEKADKAAAADKKKKGKEKTAADKAPAKTLEPLRERPDDRTFRLTGFSAPIADMIVTGDKGEETLWYIAKSADDHHLWRMGLRDDDKLEQVRQLGGRASFDRSADGSKTYVIGKNVKEMNTTNGTLTAVAVSGTHTFNKADERRAMLEFVRNEERERFYVKEMHGVDWDALVDHYSRFLPHINNNHDFAELLSELLGELNVSHTGSGYQAPGADSPTPSLGLLYDMGAAEGVKVEEVLAGSVFDKSWSKMRSGAEIVAINGTEVTSPYGLMSLLTKGGKAKTLVAFRPAPGETVVEETVTPQGSDSKRLYARWVERNEALVDSLSGGRLGYVHIPSMDDDSFREVYSKALGKYNDREGLVVDIRWNSGGRLHEDIEVLLSGRKYFTQEVRGTATCDMPSRRWNKPTVMLVNEACYSNAHGTPWVYRNRGLGQIVGSPVAGTMTSVNWVTLQDPTLYFGIPVVGYRLPDGSFLENQQLEPDVPVVENPVETAAGADKALETAVNTLLQGR